MRAVPFHLSRRFSGKAWLTVLGVALCVAFAVLSFTVAGGLGSVTGVGDGPYGAVTWIVAKPGLEPFDAEAVRLPDARHVLAAAGTRDDGQPLVVVAFEGSDAPTVAPGTLLPGRALELESATVAVSLTRTRTLEVGETHRIGAAQANWAVVAPKTLRDLEPSLSDGQVTYVRVDALDPVERDRLRDQGFLVSTSPSILPFFETGSRETANGLWLVVAFSSVLTLLLAYEFMHMEIRRKHREIGIWRALGMRRGTVAAVLLAHAALVGAAGLALGAGTALGLVHMAGRVTGLGIFTPRLDILTFTGVSAATLAAVLAGAAVPVVKAVTARIKDTLEAEA